MFVPTTTVLHHTAYQQDQTLNEGLIKLCNDQGEPLV